MKTLILALLILPLIGFSQTSKDTVYIDITVVCVNGDHIGNVTNERPGIIEYWLKRDFGGYKIRPIIIKRIVDTVKLETVNYDNILRKDETYILTPKKEDDDK